jgi:aspartate kinase
VRSSFDDPDALPGGVGNQPVGTLICDEDEIVEKQLVTGIAYSKDEAKITLRGVQDKPGVAAAIFGPLAESGINVDMIVQNISEDGSTTDITFTVPTADFERSMAQIEALKQSVVMEKVSGSKDVAKVSVIGIGMRSHAGVAAEAFRALASRGINIQLITTSEIKISILIDAAYTELAVRTLHSIYELDKT